MIRLILLLCLLWTPFVQTRGQITVYKDIDGHLLTAFDIYRTGSYNRIIYLGSPFLTFPVWQEGKIKLDTHGQELNCELAYNMATNQVLCRFVGDSTVQLIEPELFKINNTEFVRHPNRQLGYLTVLYDGPTKLFMGFSSQIEARSESNGYSKETAISGIYKKQTKYYIQKANARPESINLTRNSVLAVLNDQEEKIAPKLPVKQVTEEDVIKMLGYYDSLIAIANEPESNYNPVFKQVIYEKIAYPTQAKYQGIYGRVYAGFEVDQQGKVKNIVFLSPDNAGFGFVDEVRKFLEKLPNLDSTFTGKYALPVAFAFINSKQTTNSRMPVNSLSADRLADRTMLPEILVPVTVSKPVINAREVWGYYK